nr:uncharacterized protein LOC114284769 [Ipomoea batatas]
MLSGEKLLVLRANCCFYSLYCSSCRVLKHMSGCCYLKLLLWVLSLSGRLLPVESF